ncbi:MAG TPA: ATP-binding protein [Actinomycetota bacterium]|nr:ATP-binding protein [Actinomycetota bacterium]
MDGWPWAGGRSRLGGALVGLIASGVSTGVALLVHPSPALGVVAIYLLGVVGAAAIGRAVAGVVASLLSFLSLNYFFTAPRYTLRVARADDVVSLGVFLVVSVIVGGLVSRAVAERARAARNEREARLLSYFATKVMSGEPLGRVLVDFAGSLLEAFRLARCEIHARAGDDTFDASRARSGAEDGPSVSVPIRVGGTEVGMLTAVRAAGQPELDDDERRLLVEAAKQVAIALERALLDAQIARARVDAETNRARAALFSSVTHDLRTPLASIKAAVTTLLQEGPGQAPGAQVELDDEQRRDLLQTVLEETDRLNRLLGNLLELAKVRAGALVPAKEPTALDEVVESVLHRMADRLSGVRIRTVLRDVPEIPADPLQLDQVVTNLLDNALRFSPPGGEVMISVAPWHGSVQLRVADQGPGIQVGERERVFEAFYRGDSDERSGSGLGLAITRAIVLAHGGQIRIEGTPSGGAAVVLELPLAGAAAIPQETAT